MVLLQIWAAVATAVAIHFAASYWVAANIAKVLVEYLVVDLGHSKEKMGTITDVVNARRARCG